LVESCKKQAHNFWYGVDRITGDVNIDGSPYKAYDAEGRGYRGLSAGDMKAEDREN
ncbi:hypothetical protein COCC4DRAFT_152478, partial [Bipolaris maydis ATCC 48331]